MHPSDESPSHSLNLGPVKAEMNLGPGQVSTTFKIISIGTFLLSLFPNFLAGLNSAHSRAELIGYALAPFFWTAVLIGLLFIFKKLRTQKVLFYAIFFAALFVLFGSAGALTHPVSAP